MKFLPLGLPAILASTIVNAACAPRASVCNTTWHPLTAWEFTAALNPGYNIGNTLDAEPDETSWGQPAIVQSTIANIKAKGFRGIRLPGMYTYLRSF